MNFGQIISNSWLIMGFIMGGVEFLPNFFLGLTSQRLCWGHEYMYSVHIFMTPTKPCRAKLWPGPFRTSTAGGNAANFL